MSNDFNAFNFPYAEQFDTMNTLLASIASHQEGGIGIKGLKDIQRINRMGLAPKVFTEGDRFPVMYDGVETIWEMVGFDKETLVDGKLTNSITVAPVDCLENRQFSASQAFYNVGSGLSAGTHVFTFAVGDDDERQYEFTTAEPIPEDGVIAVSSWVDGYVISKVTTYEADRKTTIESGISVTIVSGQGNTLTPINHQHRVRYGSNEYIASSIRHWLNSDADTWVFVPQTDYDMPPTTAYPKGGFLSRLDPAFVEVLGEVEKKVARNTLTDTERAQDTFTAKAFLLSRVEVGLGSEGTTTGEAVYPLYSKATDKDRIKLLDNAARFWWLRSPHTSHARHVRHVITSGALSYYNASNAYGLSPACVIV